MREIRKLFNIYKQRDCIMEQGGAPSSHYLVGQRRGKSLFYQFLLKVMMTIYLSEDSKIYRLQELVPGDLEKERIALGLDDLKEPKISL